MILYFTSASTLVLSSLLNCPFLWPLTGQTLIPLGQFIRRWMVVTLQLRCPRIITFNYNYGAQGIYPHDHSQSPLVSILLASHSGGGGGDRWWSVGEKRRGEDAGGTVQDEFWRLTFITISSCFLILRFWWRTIVLG